MNEQQISGLVTIDLRALQANYQALVAQSPRAETAAAVKAGAYGLGLEACGRSLWEAGCRTFFVARPAEGRELRGVLPQARIFVLDGLYSGQVGYYLQHRLIPSLISLDEAREWAAFGQGAACAIHYDTGINRLGFSQAEFAALLAENLSLNKVLLMSHLVAAEEQTNPINEQQRRRFEQARALLPQVKASLANSSGVFLGEGFRLDLTRPGIALYGGNPLAGKINPMKPVVTLEARVLQVRNVPAGEATGYNSTWVARRDSRLALLGAGYRDGIPRRMSSIFGGGAKVWIAGERYPIVGRVSMDMVAVDVTGSTVQRGAMAEFFGPHIALDEAAVSAGTVSWELLTHLGNRYARHYLT